MVKVNKRNTRKKCETSSKLTIKILQQRQSCRSGVFIVNFEHISHISSFSIGKFEQVNVSCGESIINIDTCNI